MFKYNKNFAIMTLVIYMESIEKKRFFSIFDKLFFKGLLSILVYYFIFYGFSHILAIIFMPYLKYVKASEQLISALYNLIIYLTLGISFFLMCQVHSCALSIHLVQGHLSCFLVLTV